MKKLIAIITIALVMSTPAWAVGPPGSGSGVGVKTDSNCDQATYYPIGTLCQDTDDGKLYKGTGASVVEIAAGSSGDVVAATVNQTWGDGTGPVVWTYSVTGTDPTLTMTASQVAVGGTLALGANNLTMTGSLGATGARLTKGWFTDLEVTNAIAGSITGNAATATALAANPTDCAAGELATGIAANGNLTCSATPSLQALTLTGTNSLGLGTQSSATGIINFKNAANNNQLIFQAGETAATITYTLPAAAPSANGQLMTGTTAGVMSWSGAPSILALTLYGQSAGGGAQLALGSAGGSSDPNAGKINFRNATNANVFSITSGVSGADIGWTLPTAAPGGANYLLNVDADGTMGYTDPAGFLAPAGDGSSLTGLQLDQFTTQTAWRIFYSNADGDVTELALGAAGTVYQSAGASSAPGFTTYALPTSSCIENQILKADASGDLVCAADADSGGTPTVITVADEAVDATSFPLFVTAPTGDLGPKTDTAYTYDPTTGTLGATKFAGAFNGTIGATTPAAGSFTTATANSFTANKSSGVAGDMGLYEANSTDTHAAGFRGPASITGDGAYRIQFPNARASGAGQVIAATNAGESGTGTAADPYVQTGSWITPATADSSTTFTEKTFDVEGTNNVLKTWDYIVLTHPHLCAAGAPMQTTNTANTFGQCKFGNATDKATNYAEYYLVVPPDIDTAVDLTATFKIKLGGADTGDHEYEISFDSVADSAAYAGSLSDAVSLAFTADASGADGDVETAGPTTLTGWRSAMTAGQLFVIRVARDGDHANDGSSVDSYSGPLIIKYKKTQ